MISIFSIIRYESLDPFITLFQLWCVVVRYRIWSPRDVPTHINSFTFVSASNVTWHKHEQIIMHLKAISRALNINTLPYRQISAPLLH